MIAKCACADVSDFKHRDVKMLLLNILSEHWNLVKKRYKQNFHKMECTVAAFLSNDFAWAGGDKGSNISRSIFR